MPANVLTFDVECWFHAHNLRGAITREAWDELPPRIETPLDQILTALNRFDVRATFFILGWVAERHPETVARIMEGGHEIGTHGYSHATVSELGPTEFERDLERSVDILERLGAEVHSHRASNFSISAECEWALEILAAHGITCDSSIYPIGRRRYGISGYAVPAIHRLTLANGASIVEAPLSTRSVAGRRLPFGGGGYLRLYPLSLTKLLIRQLNAQGVPAIVYLHPWELDAGQPVVATSRRLRFQHRVNLHRTYERLLALLASFQFTTLADAVRTSEVLPTIQFPAVGVGRPVATGHSPSHGP
jgi:polysaccharide deacetylase family protein (PEP-CTERM system associated)